MVNCGYQGIGQSTLSPAVMSRKCRAQSAFFVHICIRRRARNLPGAKPDEAKCGIIKAFLFGFSRNVTGHFRYLYIFVTTIKPALTKLILNAIISARSKLFDRCVKLYLNEMRLNHAISKHLIQKILFKGGFENYEKSQKSSCTRCCINNGARYCCIRFIY